MMIFVAVAIVIAHIVGHNATEIITDMPVLSEDFDPHPTLVGCYQSY
ncbi:hypothetical protein [Vagococcus bubulae]|nr:hypothetical protein [Vagococcus bubulae]